MTSRSNLACGLEHVALHTSGRTECADNIQNSHALHSVENATADRHERDVIKEIIGYENSATLNYSVYSLASDHLKKHHLAGIGMMPNTNLVQVACKI